MKNNIIITGGGTGGHIFPAIAMAKELIKNNPNLNIVFFGAKGKMEMEIVKKYGFKIIGLPIIGLEKKINYRLFKFITYFFYSLLYCIFYIKTKKIKIVIGTGGYASSPAMFAAYVTKTIFFIQEQNSIPGKVNKILSKKATKIFTHFSGMEKYFPKEKILLMGNPMLEKNSLTVNENIKKKWNLAKEKTLLIIGGSQGALAINKEIKNIIKKISIEEKYNVIWQTGKNFYAEASSIKNLKNIKIIDFIDNIIDVYKISTLVVTRAGAMSISEISNLNIPAIYIPLPTAAESHQEKNAMYIKKNRGGEVVLQKNIEQLYLKIDTLINDDIKLDLYRLNLKKISFENSSKKISKTILNYLN